MLSLPLCFSADVSRLMSHAQLAPTTAAITQTVYYTFTTVISHSLLLWRGEAPHAASETRRWDNTRGERAFTHTHTERERVVAAHGLCLAHQHTETLIQAECVCVWRSKRKRGKVRKGPQSKHVVGFSVALFLILIWLFNQLLDKLFGPLSVRKWWKMLISVFKSPRRRPCFVYNPKDLQFTVKDDLKNWTY